MDPVTLSALISAGSSVLGKMMGKSGAPLPPNESSSSGYTNAAFDNSGWNVSTGSGFRFGGQAAGSTSSLITYAALAVGAVWLLRHR